MMQVDPVSPRMPYSPIEVSPTTERRYFDLSFQMGTPPSPIVGDESPDHLRFKKWYRAEVWAPALGEEYELSQTMDCGGDVCASPHAAATGPPVVRPGTGMRGSDIASSSTSVPPSLTQSMFVDAASGSSTPAPRMSMSERAHVLSNASAERRQFLDEMTSVAVPVWHAGQERYKWGGCRDCPHLSLQPHLNRNGKVHPGSLRLRCSSWFKHKDSKKCWYSYPFPMGLFEHLSAPMQEEYHSLQQSLRRDSNP